VSSHGTLITLEGIDGAGKTTLAEAVRDALRGREIEVRLLREPGGVEAAERIRELVHDPALQIGARAETLLYAAARAQLVQESLAPLLHDGALVLLDRFVDSSLVYQGTGRGLGVDRVAAVNAFATGGLVPDRTLLLDLDPALARRRSSDRDAPPDRIEQEADDFFAQIASAYRELAAAEPARFRILDAAQPGERVLADALAAIADLTAQPE
jgi:dTMP kinase